MLFIGWNANGKMIFAPADHLTAGLIRLDDIEQCAIVRAFFSPGTRLEDPDLHYFNSRYENTRLPTEHLWGPGSPTKAATWLTTTHPTCDSVDLLDQVFAIRHDSDRVYRPMKPGVVALLDPADQTGHWYLVQADFPQDAFVHIRKLLAAEPGCNQRGQCTACPVEILDQGTVGELVGRGHLAPTNAALPPAFSLRDDIPTWQPAPPRTNREPCRRFPKFDPLGAEAMTRLSEAPVTDEMIAQAAEQFTEVELAQLMWTITVINACNRLGATARPWPLS